jgi:FG-GAP-like repeat
MKQTGMFLALIAAIFMTMPDVVQGQQPAPRTWSSLVNPPPVNLSNPLLLTDGTIIAHHRCAPDWYKFTPDNNGNYINGTWSAIASLPSGYGPLSFGSAVLPDGRVIIMGGEYNSTSGSCGSAVDTALGAIYDPVADAWTPVSAPEGWQNIGDAAGIVLPNGTYMQTGCCSWHNSVLPSAALLNPVTLAWTSTATGKFDTYGEESLALLPTGQVLTVDAYVSGGTCGTNSETYDPATGAWTSAGSTITQQSDCSGLKTHEVGPLVMRPDGTAVSFSGVTTGTSQTAIYNTGNGTWSVGPSQPSVNGVPYTMADAPAAVLPSGNVLVAMSPSNWSNNKSFPVPTHYFELDLSSSTFIQVPDKSDAAFVNSNVVNFLVLPTGQVMAFTSGAPTVQIYTPAGNPNPAWVPAITDVPNCLNAGGTYVARGTQFNGLSQGAYYGDDVNAWTNYPLVRISNNSTQHVFYARTSNFSTMSIAPGTRGLTDFLVPANIELGPSTLLVEANGIPSVGVPVTVASGGCGNGSRTATHDFNGDARSDVLWRDDSGNVGIWLMNGTQVLQASVVAAAPLAWTIVGQRDFDGDGKHDLLWRDTSGNLGIWFMNGTQVVQAAVVANVSTSWMVAGTADFNGDGKGDVLWRDAGGNVGIWLMKGTQILQAAGIGNVSTSWSVAGTADFNGDGNGDILWRDTSGNIGIWLMNGAQVMQAAVIGTAPLSWTIVGTGDFNGDGKSDILLRDTSGNVAIWLMNGTQILQAAIVGAAPLSWTIAETGDFNGDLKTDILWRDSSGNVGMWLMNGTQLLQAVAIGAASTVWRIQGANAD